MKKNIFSYDYKKVSVLRVIAVLLLISLACLGRTSTAQDINGILIVSEETNATNQNTQDSNLSLKMSETASGITISVDYTTRKKQAINSLLEPGVEMKSGGEVRLFIDNNLLIHTFFDEEEYSLEHPVNTELLENGEHTVRCEIAPASGERLSETLRFAIDASPRITVTPPGDGKGVFDPGITVHFPGGSEEFAGMLEIGIDAQSIVQVPVGRENNNHLLSLSGLIGDRFDMSRLPQGEHLLKVSATAVNGSRTTRYTAFTVDSTPAISFSRDDDGNFQQLSVTFRKSGQGFSGTIEVYRENNMILARQVREETITLSREDLKHALEKYKTSFVQEKTGTIVVAARSANGTEKWLTVDFK